MAIVLTHLRAQIYRPLDVPPLTNYLAGTHYDGTPLVIGRAHPVPAIKHLGPVMGEGAVFQVDAYNVSLTAYLAGD